MTLSKDGNIHHLMALSKQKGEDNCNIRIISEFAASIKGNRISINELPNQWTSYALNHINPPPD